MRGAIFHWPARHPWATVAIAALVAVAAGLSALRLRPDTSLESLFSPTDPAARALVRVLNDFSAADELLVLVTTPAGEPRPERLLAFADRLTNEIKRDAQGAGTVSRISYRADAQSRAFVSEVIAPNGLFYLSDVDFEAAKRRLSRAGDGGPVSTQ